MYTFEFTIISGNEQRAFIKKAPLSQLLATFDEALQWKREAAEGESRFASVYGPNIQRCAVDELTRRRIVRIIPTPKPVVEVVGIVWADFVQVTYPNLEAQYQRLELANVIDHYLQALTLRSAWPISLGIFTAMETLRSAYFYQTEDRADKEAESWVVPNGDFQADQEISSKLIELLGDHFPRFHNLTSNERQSLTAQLMNNINRRSYKTQLVRMLEQFGVCYQRRELQPFIDIRNRIVHCGTPVRSDVTITDYEKRTSEALGRIDDATSLLERALLAVLGYTGPRELFNAEEGRIHND